MKQMGIDFIGAATAALWLELTGNHHSNEVVLDRTGGDSPMGDAVESVERIFDSVC